MSSFPLPTLLRDQLNVPADFIAWHGDVAIPAESEVVINAPSVGLFDSHARVPIDTDGFRAGQIVADVVFSPVDTRLLKEARERGATTLDGLGMLVNEARLNFKIWTGVDPDAELMRDALEEYLGV